MTKQDPSEGSRKVKASLPFTEASQYRPHQAEPAGSRAPFLRKNMTSPFPGDGRPVAIREGRSLISHQDPWVLPEFRQK